ncbi:ATP-binding protein [Streptomyces sp. NPDC002589]|uniref:sensor histidine kinase n=1 Tax=Streptomyces sp. NPDC002589 TaxID=3154420 RepID=UPI00332A2244
MTVSSAAAVWLGSMFYGVRRADAAIEGANEHQENLVGGLEDLRAAVSKALERVEQGDLNGVSAAPPEFTGSLSADPALAVEQLLFLARTEVDHAISRAAQLHQRSALGERAQTELLRTIAQRQNALVGRTLAALDKAENSVEDPDILNDFFGIDHLVTQLRRFTENIAVLGGQSLAGRPRDPLPVSTALRQAVEEIERYDRVRVGLAPDKLSFPGHVGPSVVHLLAELLENATQFSDSRTKVQLTATVEQGGLVIAVRDQGMSMTPALMYQLNEQLAAPQTVDVYSHLKGGRIGLVVTGQLAQRCGIRVQLQANTDGPGVTAFALIPNAVLMTSTVAPAQSVSAPTPESVPYQGLPEPSVHQGRSGLSQPAGALGPIAMEAPAARQHATEAPTEGRAPLPRRPASPAAGQTSAPPQSALASNGPTPGLMAQYRAGAHHAAGHRPAGE